MFSTCAKRLCRQVARNSCVVKGVTTQASSVATPTDKIMLEGLVFHGYHGVLEEERQLGQKFVIDASLTTCLRKAGQTDNLEDTIDYARVYTQIRDIVQGKPHLLIERLADQIARTVLTDHPLVEGISVAVRKPQVAVDGVVDALGVCITRTRHDYG